MKIDPIAIGRVTRDLEDSSYDLETRVLAFDEMDGNCPSGALLSSSIDELLRDANKLAVNAKNVGANADAFLVEMGGLDGEIGNVSFQQLIWLGEHPWEGTPS